MTNTNNHRKMKIEEKAQAYAEEAFLRALKAPWPEAKKEFANAYNAGADEVLAGQWRSVEKELPKAEQEVMVAIDTQTNHQLAVAWISTLSNGTLRWYCYDDTFPLDKIRYWMPIPDLPKPLKK